MRLSDVLIVANGAPPLSLSAHNEFLIAVDGGLNSCIRLGLKPDLVMGDFDSASPEHLKKYPRIHLPNPNKCDLEKTLEFLFALPIRSAIVYGTFGRRVDHMLTNICLLCRYPGKVQFESEYERCLALPKKHTFSCRPGQTLSLIPISTEVTEVETEGLKWELHGETLSKDFVGISNLATQPQVTISHGTGDLLLTLTHDSADD